MQEWLTNVGGLPFMISLAGVVVSGILYREFGEYWSRKITTVAVAALLCGLLVMQWWQWAASCRGQTFVAKPEVSFNAGDSPLTAPSAESNGGQRDGEEHIQQPSGAVIDLRGTGLTSADFAASRAMGKWVKAGDNRFVWGSHASLQRKVTPYGVWLITADAIVLEGTQQE